MRTTKLLKKYCLTVLCINDLDTYIISPAQYHDFIVDKNLWEKSDSDIARTKNFAIDLIQITKKVGAGMLYLSFVHHANYRIWEFEPVLCYKYEAAYYHVVYRDSWMCRECNNILYAPIIMPADEHDAVFYSGTKNQFPDIPPFFQKIPCPKCNRLLQNHLIFIDVNKLS